MFKTMIRACCPPLFRALSAALMLATGLACSSSGGDDPAPPPPPAGPSIQSFHALPSVIPSGDSPILLARYTGGTGRITPGDVALESGRALSLGPLTEARTYTLTVTGSGGKTVTQTAAITLGPAKQSSRIMLGYSTGSSAALSSASSHASYLNTVSSDIFNIQADGTVAGANGTDAIVAQNKTRGIHTYACIPNIGANGFDAALAHSAIVTNKTKVIANLLSLAQIGAYTGINIDFESLAYSPDIDTDRAAYTSFIHDLATTLHSHGFKLIISTPAKSSESKTNTWAYPFDYAALGQDVDYIQLMTYDQHGPWSSSGPVSGADWVEECLVYAKSLVPSSKLLIGLPAYGYDWNLTASTGSDFTWTQVPSLLAKAGAVEHWDATALSPSVTYTEGGQNHVAWFENAASIQAKTALVTEHDLGGVSVWALGQENLSFWQAVVAGME